MQPIALFRPNVRTCWITTYNLDIGLFDSFLYPRLGDAPLNAVVLADAGRLDNVLASVPPTEHWRLNRANRRWLLRGIRYGGAFHPKTILVQGPAATKLLIGSGNLSLSGLDNGHETFVTVTSSDPAGAATISSWLAWIKEVVARADDPQLRRRFADLVAEVPDLPEPSNGLVHNLRSSILDQLVDALERPVTELHAAAPFFDQDVAALSEMIARVKPARLTVYLADHANIDGVRLRRVLDASDGHVRVMRYRPSSFVHAKLVGLVFDDGRGLLMSGSCNMSRAALLGNVATDGWSNVEVAVLTAAGAGTVRDAFTNPPRLVAEPFAEDSLANLTFERDEGPAKHAVKLLRAHRDDRGRVEVATDPAEVPPDSYLTDGDSVVDLVNAELGGRLIWLVDEANAAISNRVVVDEVNELEAQLRDRQPSTSGRPAELASGDLSTPLGEMLAFLHERCLLDFAESPASEFADRGTESESEDAENLWDRLAKDELRRDPRVSTYQRVLGRVGALDDPLVELLAAMLARVPPEVRLAMSNVVPFPVPEPDEEESADDVHRRWSEGARIRVRARNVLRRWADAISDPRLQWIDPAAPVFNYQALTYAVAALRASNMMGTPSGLLDEDLDEIAQRLVDAILTVIDRVSDDDKGRLDRETTELTAALTYLAVRHGGDRRGRVLDWQPRIEKLLEADLLTPDDGSAAYLTKALGRSVVVAHINDALLEALDFIDDEEWCRRSAEELGLRRLRIEGISTDEVVDVRLAVDGIDRPLADPRTLRLVADVCSYRNANIIALFDDRDRWRLAFTIDDFVSFRADRLRDVVDSSSPLTPNRLNELVAAGSTLAELFAPEHRAA